MKVKTDFTGCYYITPNKEYEARSWHGSSHIFCLYNDQGDITIIRPFGPCAHLDGDNWQIVED